MAATLRCLPVGAGVEVVAGVAAGEDVVARAWLRAGGEVLVGVQRHHAQRPVGHRHVEVLSAAGALPTQQGGGDGQRGVHPSRGDVGHSRARQRGSAIGAASAAVQIARHGQVVEVVAGPLPPGARLAESAGRAVDDSLVDGPHRPIADAEPVGHAGTETLDDHVAGSGDGQERLTTSVALEVEQRPAHAPMAAVGVRGRHHRHSGLPGHRPDLHHLRAVVGEQPAGPRPGATDARSRTLTPSSAPRGGRPRSPRGSCGHALRDSREGSLWPHAAPVLRSSWGVRGPGGR